MKTGRLEAFSDGVLAIIITIMVLELEAPEELTFAALKPALPVFLSYVLSFIYVGIFWMNHHHLFQITEKVNGKILWANLHLLFWLSLIPFATSWMGEHHLKTTPTFFYGVILLMGGLAFTLLQQVIVKAHPEGFPLKTLLGKRGKEKISTLFYVIGIASSFFSPWLAIACYVAVALIWLAPDKRIENLNA